MTLPQDEQGWKTAGDAPLQGTPDTLPAPPQGVVQQRLTFTHHKPFPGTGECAASLGA